MLFDYRQSLARLGGDPQLFREIVFLFLADSPVLLERLHRALEASDARAVERAAHSLKGLAANFDSAPTVAAAQQIEQTARRQELAAAREAVPELTEWLARLRQALDEFCGPNTTDWPPRQEATAP